MPFSIVNGAPPNQTPPLDAQGRFTAPWYSYLVSLQKSNSGVVVGLGGLDLNGQVVTGSATFEGAVAFAVAPSFADAAGTRSALGLGSAAPFASSAFDAAGAAAAAQAAAIAASDTAGAAAAAQAAAIAASLQRASNLSDLASAATARANLGLGTAATQASSAFDAAGAASAAVAGIPNASATVTGHLLAADWSTFNGKQAALGYTPLNPANNLSDVAAAATARANLAAAGTAVSNTFTASQIVQAASLTLTNNFAAGATGYLQLQSAPASPRAGRLTFGTDGSGWSFTIAKNVAGTLTDILTVKDDLSVAVAGAMKTAALTTAVRTVTAADTATTADHTILGNIGSAVSETLPAAPLTGQEFYLVNISAFVWTIAGNGKNIWAAGVSAASITLASNVSAVLKYDGTLWRRIV